MSGAGRPRQGKNRRGASCGKTARCTMNSTRPASSGRFSLAAVIRDLLDTIAVLGGSPQNPKRCRATALQKRAGDELMTSPHADDEKTLQSLGYTQELHRGMSAFSNFAISLSIICILAGGVTSFHVGLCSVGGAAIGLGWPLATLFALVVALTMGQVASAFPTAGGL